jgi:hemolysin activation/secretion protein
MVRSPNFNLYAQLQYDRKKLDDRIDIVFINTQRRLGNKVFSISGDARDKLLSDSASIWNLGYTSGNVVFEDIAARQSDALTAKTAGAFTKWTFNFTRMQGLTQSDSIYLNVTRQWAHSNLDSAEKMIAGGVYSVRAYDMGAASGDSGYSETVELRHDFRSYAHGQWQAVTFIDGAHVVVNHTPWTTGTNAATLSGAGVGLNWLGPDRLSAKGYIAKPIGTIPDLLPATRSARAWLVVTKSF